MLIYILVSAALIKNMATLELEARLDNLQARLDNLLSTSQTETADISLFAPILEREECPICLIPLPIGEREIIFMTCCGKRICMGCVNKHVMTEIKNGVPIDDYKCAFCRQSVNTSDKEDIKALKKLMKMNNPDAFMQMAARHKEGKGVLQSNTRALELYTRAAELDHAPAFAAIGECYNEGIAGGEDRLKAAEFWEISAKKGCVYSHKELSLVRARNGDIQTSIEHLKVAASAGGQDAMNGLMKAYKEEALSKEDLSQTLRAFQASRDETKSKDRDEARAMKWQRD